jgi:hypothetical protein
MKLVYRFKLSKYITKKCLFGEKRIKDLMFREYVYEDYDEKIQIFKNKNHQGYLDPTEFVDMRDYLDTIRAMIDSAKASVSL